MGWNECLASRGTCHQPRQLEFGSLEQTWWEEKRTGSCKLPSGFWHMYAVACACTHPIKIICKTIKRMITYHTKAIDIRFGCYFSSQSFRCHISRCAHNSARHYCLGKLCRSPGKSKVRYFGSKVFV